MFYVRAERVNDRWRAWLRVGTYEIEVTRWLPILWRFLPRPGSAAPDAPVEGESSGRRDD